MLDWIWFSVLSIAAMAFAIGSECCEDDKSIDRQLYSVVCACTSIAISWNVLGAKLLSLYLSVLPLGSPDVQLFTAVVLFGATILGYCFLITAVPASVVENAKSRRAQC